MNIAKPIHTSLPGGCAGDDVSNVYVIIDIAAWATSIGVVITFIAVLFHSHQLYLELIACVVVYPLKPSQTAKAYRECGHICYGSCLYQKCMWVFMGAFQYGYGFGFQRESCVTSNRYVYVLDQDDK